MPSERRFCDDGTKATWFHKPNDGDDRMKENDEDVVHAGIVSKSQKPADSGRFCNSPLTRDHPSIIIAKTFPRKLVLWLGRRLARQPS
jgi:hypothetical protein